MLRVVSPYEFVEALKQNSFEVTNVEIGHKEGRIDYGYFVINEYNIQYQVCGLFAGDEWIIFPENTPKNLVDKVLAVLKLTLAEHMIQHHNQDVGFVVTPGEFIAEVENKVLSYRDKELNRAREAVNDARNILKGKRSFFDKELKNYTRSKTLGEAVLLMITRMMILDTTLKEEMRNEKEINIFLVKEYLEWKIKTTGFENLYDSFPEKVKSNYEGLSTSQERGWGEHTDRQKKEIRFLKTALDNPKMIIDVMKLGDKILPILQEKLKEVENYW